MCGKALFLDRDGTINIDKGYLYKIEDFEFIKGAVDALRIAQEEGYKLIIISNQSGIARGYYTENDFELLNNWMILELKSRGVHIDAVYYCPHLPDAIIPQYRIKCSCRKPGISLFEKAAKEQSISFENSWCIGDRMRDLSICEVYSIRGILIGNSEQERIIKEVQTGQRKRIEYAPDLLNAVKNIIYS